MTEWLWACIAAAGIFVLYLYVSAFNVDRMKDKTGYQPRPYPHTRIIP